MNKTEFIQTLNKYNSTLLDKEGNPVWFSIPKEILDFLAGYKEPDIALIIEDVDFKVDWIHWLLWFCPEFKEQDTIFRDKFDITFWRQKGYEDTKYASDLRKFMTKAIVLC